MFLSFVGKNTLNWFNSISFTDFSNICGDGLIGFSDSDSSCGSEESVVGSKDNISLFTLGFSSNTYGMSSLSSISINMST